jgi:hypothetical protein
LNPIKFKANSSFLFLFFKKKKEEKEKDKNNKKKIGVFYYNVGDVIYAPFASA